MDCNNQTWELASQPDRTAEESAEILDAAHTASLNWPSVVTDLNVMRAKMLLAEVHALLSMGNTALAPAKEGSDFFESRKTDDWEMAFVCTIHAHAANASGDGTSRADKYQVANVAIDDIADDEDREIVMQTCRPSGRVRVPSSPLPAQNPLCNVPRSRGR